MKAKKTMKSIEPKAEYMTWRLVECSYHSLDKVGGLHV